MGLSSNHSFSEDLLGLPQGNKTSIYILLLAKLNNFSIKNDVDYQQVKSLNAVLKQMILNHCQGLKLLLFHVKQTITIRGLSSQFQAFLKDVHLALKSAEITRNSSIKEITETDLEARISRQLESQIAIHLLQSPSQAMWNSVNKISQSIIELINIHADKPELFSSFLHNINGKKDSELEPNIPLAFAHFSSTKTLDDVVAILHEGNDLSSVMLIQFMFMREAFLKLDIPQSFYDTILAKEHTGNFKNFLLEQSLLKDALQISEFFTQ